MHSDILKEVYEKYHREIYIYIYSICKNKAQAEDILQETFLKALLTLPDDNRALRAWLYKVARNITFNEIKKNKRCEELKEDTLLEEREMLPNERLMKSLNKLSPIKKEVLLLQYIGGFDQNEIARILNTSPNNVRVLSFRGRNELRKLMEGKEDDI